MKTCTENSVISLLQGFPFLYHQIRDNINLQHTCNLIFSVCRWNEHMAMAVSCLKILSGCVTPKTANPAALSKVTVTLLNCSKRLV